MGSSEKSRTLCVSQTSAGPHILAARSQRLQKLGQRLATGTAQLQAARKKFIAKVGAAISDRSPCTAAWRPALLLCSSAACWTTGLREARYSYFYPTFEGFEGRGCGGNQLCGLMSEMTNETQFRKQVLAGRVLPRRRSRSGGSTLNFLQLGKTPPLKRTTGHARQTIFGLRANPSLV